MTDNVDRSRRSEDAVFHAEMALVGFERDALLAFEVVRNAKMLELAEAGYSLNCIAQASGYALSRVCHYVKRAREQRGG